VEHRWGRRLDTSVDVSLFGHPCVVGRGRIRNVSMTGAFVQTSLALPPLAQLDIELHSRLPLGCETYRIAASVVRTSSDGLGIEWREPVPAGIVSLTLGRAVPSKSRLGGARVPAHHVL